MDSELVIEAVFGDMKSKRETFAKLEECRCPDSLFSSNCTMKARPVLRPARASLEVAPSKASSV